MGSGSTKSPRCSGCRPQPSPIGRRDTWRARPWEIPEIDPGEINHLGKSELDKMSDEELRRYIHELEVKVYVLEGTVKV